MRLATAVLATLLGSSAALAITGAGTTLLGNNDLEGGSTSLGFISAGTNLTNGGKAEGNITNKTGSDADDIGIDIVGGSVGSVRVEDLNGNEIESAVPNGNGVVDLDFPPQAKFNEDETLKIKLDGLATSTGQPGITILCTPSKNTTLAGGAEVDVLAELGVDAVANLRRTGGRTLFNRGFAARVLNADVSERINRIDGTVAVPGNSTASIVAVAAYDESGTALSGANYGVSGLTFDVTGFPAIPVGSSVEVVVILDAGSQGLGYRADLEASFTP
jgi:hypothetical protein